MGYSIQEYLKKINSNLSSVAILSLFVTTTILALLFVYLNHKEDKSNIGVNYVIGTELASPLLDKDASAKEMDPRPFGSSKGKTYTFTWCQGASRIASKNKIYFGSEEEARLVGRTLSKLCTK